MIMRIFVRNIGIVTACLFTFHYTFAESLDIFLNSPVTSSANISLLVQDLHSGELIDCYRPQNVAPPASVMKLLPTATALETLGADYQFSTYIEYSGYISNGVLYGDLYVRGTGDPTLGSQKVGDRNFLNRWVKAIREAGIREIRGAVIADLSYFDAALPRCNTQCRKCLVCSLTIIYVAQASHMTARMYMAQRTTTRAI